MQPTVTLKDTGSQESPTVKGVEASHEYEMLENYQQSYEEIQAPQAPCGNACRKLPEQPKQPQMCASGEYDISECPAYESVGQKAQTSTTQPPTNDDQDQPSTVVSGDEYETVCTIDT